MKYYTRLFDKVKGNFKNLYNKLGKDLKRPKYKLIVDMINGIIASKSVRLTQIARTLNEDILLKKTVERLSNSLCSCDDTIRKTIEKNYLNYANEFVQENTVISIDNSDIVKPHSTKLESLGRVRDGSTGEINVKGYFTSEAIALSANRKEPISLITRLYSPSEKEFISENAECLNMLDVLKETLGSKGIYVFDRGFDSNDNFKYFLEEKNSRRFLIRLKKNRHVRIDKKKMSLYTAEDYLRFEKVKFTTCHGKEIELEMGSIEITLPDKELQEHILRLVMIRKDGNVMYLITNILDIEIIAKSIYETYLDRWKIEEYFKFKKQQYDLEKSMVRNLNGLRMLQLLVMIITGFMSILADNKSEMIIYKSITNEAKPVKKDDKVKLHIYRIGNGISKILTKINTRIRDYFITYTQKHFSEQINLFNPCYTKTISNTI